MKRILLKLSLICFLIFALHSYAKAQIDPDGDPEVPLDPGSWVLVAAGVGYGVKKWIDVKQQNRNNSTGTDKHIDQKEKQTHLY
jgi:hypothetical protein